MKTPDEIKKAFECCMQMHGCKECSYSGERCTVELSKDALSYIQQLEEDRKERDILADAYQQLEAAQPKWISVEERLPEVDMGVMCVAQTAWGPEVTEGYFWKHSQMISPIDEGCAVDKVTHWMPLPEPPKGGLT